MQLTRIFHTHLISTGLQPGGMGAKLVQPLQRLFRAVSKPLKRFEFVVRPLTGLKPGVNERVVEECEICGLSAASSIQKPV